MVLMRVCILCSLKITVQLTNNQYQSYIQTDLSGLRKAGCTKKFLLVNQGVATYLDWLNLGIR